MGKPGLTAPARMRASLFHVHCTLDWLDILQYKVDILVKA